MSVEEIFNQLRPIMLRLAVKGVGSVDLAEDLVQEVALRVFKKPGPWSKNFIMSVFKSELAHYQDNKTLRKKGRLARQSEVSTNLNEDLQMQAVLPLDKPKKKSYYSYVPLKPHVKNARKLWRKRKMERATFVKRVHEKVVKSRLR